MAQRPRNYEEFRAVTGFETPEGVARGLALKARPTDIFISPYSKCGTTWMQQIVHGLRSGGSMDFTEITEVVPWLELAHDMGVDLEAPQVAEPRAFKSHLPWEDIPKGGRYIVVLRDPLDAMLSLYRFFEGWWFETGAVSLEEFSGYYLTRGAEGWWHHAASWLRVRDREEVLLIGYEHMKRDLPGAVAQVAAHMGGYPAEVQAIATRQAGFDFMKAHGGQFDDNLVRKTRDAACGLPPGGAATKVASGQSGAGTTVPETMKQAFEAQWQATIGAEFGFASYAELLESLTPDAARASR
ncbi:MAG: sulfotransferase domain-containing protein [Roseovarius sp.]